MYIYIYIYIICIYIYIYTSLYIYIYSTHLYIYIYIERERERQIYIYIYIYTYIYIYIYIYTSFCFPGKTRALIQCRAAVAQNLEPYMYPNWPKTEPMPKNCPTKPRTLCPFFSRPRALYQKLIQTTFKCIFEFHSIDHR